MVRERIEKRWTVYSRQSKRAKVISEEKKRRKERKKERKKPKKRETQTLERVEQPKHAQQSQIIAIFRQPQTHQSNESSKEKQKNESIRQFQYHTGPTCQHTRTITMERKEKQSGKTIDR
jgi:hypothetical protein